MKNWLLSGDTHGNVLQRLANIDPSYNPEETAIIILGDLGLNFYLDKGDQKRKKRVHDTGYVIYALRGNHEERPENLGMETYWDPEVGNSVYLEEEFPNIRYLIDGFTYQFGSHSALVIGGAYSVDKWHRLQRAAATNQSFTGWFPSEQLTKKEMLAITKTVAEENFAVDFVLSHTCPLRYQPTDLFLNCVDQSSVDNSMEVWMDSIVDRFKWNIWCYGHYHADRIEAPYVEQFYTEIENINTVWNRWYDEKTLYKEWWLPMSPAMEKLMDGGNVNL